MELVGKIDEQIKKEKSTKNEVELPEIKDKNRRAYSLNKGCNVRVLLYGDGRVETLHENTVISCLLKSRLNIVNMRLLRKEGVNPKDWRSALSPDSYYLVRKAPEETEELWDNEIYLTEYFMDEVESSISKGETGNSIEFSLAFRTVGEERYGELLETKERLKFIGAASTIEVMKYPGEPLLEVNRANKTATVISKKQYVVGVSEVIGNAFLKKIDMGEVRFSEKALEDVAGLLTCKLGGELKVGYIGLKPDTQGMNEIIFSRQMENRGYTNAVERLYMDIRDAKVLVNHNLEFVRKEPKAMLDAFKLNGIASFKRFHRLATGDCQVVEGALDENGNREIEILLDGKKFYRTKERNENDLGAFFRDYENIMKALKFGGYLRQ